MAIRTVPSLRRAGGRAEKAEITSSQKHVGTCLCFFRSLQQGSQFSPRAGTKVTSRELFTEATNSTRPAEKRLRAAERGTGRGRVAIRTVPPLYVYQPYTKHAARPQQAWSRSTAARLPHPEAARKGKS